LRQAFFRVRTMIFPRRCYSTIAPCSYFNHPAASRYNINS